MRITSLQNQRIKDVVKLQQRKHRDKQAKMIIEGYRAILYALENGYPMEALYCCPSLYFGKNEPNLITHVQSTGTQLVEVSEPVFLKMALRARPEGLLAVAPQIRQPLHMHTPPQNALYIMAESIEKPANLGSILRTADGAGAHAVVVCNACTDIFNPNVVRASVGTFFSVPTLDSSSQQALDWCRRHNICVVAATPAATMSYTDVDMRRPVAIAVGTEQVGLSALWLEQADFAVKLPMLGQVNSLNVSVATSILLYEAVRQRSQPSDC
ncbi:MAG: RNA methyltransferase [Caldilineaceae bacterium]|nr:RNA methyltransferase [Caldilineaceae bacterium]MCB0145783.1 RNA methyltransferase [Caldilineaceae bacterium]